MNDFLISLQDIQNYLYKQGYNSPTNINADNNLQMMREAAQDRIRKYLGYNFISASYTDEYYNGNGMRLLYSRHRPIITLNSVKIDNAEQNINKFTTIDDGNAVYYIDGYFPTEINNIKLSYQAGWTRTTMPPSIRLAALRLCALWYNQQNREGKTSESQENGVSAAFDFNESNILESIYNYKAMSW